jgi:hypothetical protein
MFGDSFTQRATAPLRQTEGVGAGVSPYVASAELCQLVEVSFFSFLRIVF